jgi:Fe-S-cluster containining protein
MPRAKYSQKPAACRLCPLWFGGGGGSGGFVMRRYVALAARTRVHYREKRMNSTIELMTNVKPMKKISAAARQTGGSVRA